jgi:uncharacterized protein YerC
VINLPKVSSKEVKGEGKLVLKFWDDINAMSSSEREDYFEHLMTPTEILMFAKRGSIFKDLINKRSYNEISKEYGVGVNTISRLSNTLHQADTDFIVILTKLASKDEKKGIFG